VRGGSEGLRLWQALRGRSLGWYKFIRQERMGPYYAGLVFREAKLVVEIDGRPIPRRKSLQRIERDDFSWNGPLRKWRGLSANRSRAMRFLLRSVIDRAFATGPSPYLSPRCGEEEASAPRSVSIDRQCGKSRRRQEGVLDEGQRLDLRRSSADLFVNMRTAARMRRGCGVLLSHLRGGLSRRLGHLEHFHLVDVVAGVRRQRHVRVVAR